MSLSENLSADPSLPSRFKLEVRSSVAHFMDDANSGVGQMLAGPDCARNQAEIERPENTRGDAALNSDSILSMQSACNHCQMKKKSFRELIEEMSSLQAALLESHEREILLRPEPPATSVSAPPRPSTTPPTPSTRRLLGIEPEGPIPELPGALAYIPSRRKRFNTGGLALDRAAQAARASEQLEEAALSGGDDADNFQIRKMYDVEDHELVGLKMWKKRSFTESKTVGWKDGEDPLHEIVQKSCYINPSSTGRLFWDLFALLILAYDMVIIPMQVFELPKSELLQAVDIVVAVYWTVDIPTTMLTAVYVHGRLEVRRAAIIKLYASSWMAFDIAVVTVDWISHLSLNDSNAESVSLARALRSGRILRMLRILRLLRIMRLKRLLDDLKARVNSASVLFSINVAQLFLVTAFLTHALACTWYAIGDTENGWVHTEGLFHLSLEDTYLKSFQWSLSRLHPSTMQDNMRLQTNAERLWALAASFGALLFSSIFISTITNTMAKLQRIRKDRNMKMEAVSSYCASHGIKAHVAVKMKKHIDREEQRRRQMQSHELLQDALPPVMLKMLFHSSRSSVLSMHDFFRRIQQKYPGTEADLCFSALSEVCYLPGDVVFDVGNLSTCMYMVCWGNLAYHIGKGNLRGTSTNQMASSWFLSFLDSPHAQAGDEPISVRKTTPVERMDWLSEPSLWVSVWHNAGHLQAISTCNLIAISANNLAKCLQQDRAALAEVIVYARFFVQELNTMTCHTDLAPEADAGGEDSTSSVSRMKSITPT
eukprot:TRINITY_DN5366_c1_g1_i1.p1 TRINITY_DN5366_c1_g1~~TRINITY_DN5366_c1_g1_i1.p1  ORF type:complete len:770 (-),score=122.39 TRINITY_DN5366_c1_g1_i1:76-2385(-)